jgi:hypothetical protein
LVAVKFAAVAEEVIVLLVLLPVALFESAATTAAWEHATIDSSSRKTTTGVVSDTESLRVKTPADARRVLPVFDSIHMDERRTT